MEDSQRQGLTRFSVVLVVLALLVGAVGGGLIGYSIVSKEVNDLQNQVSTLQKEISNLQSMQDVTHGDSTYILGENASLSSLYEQVADSVVVIRGVLVQYDIFHRAFYSQVQGSGFVYNFTGEMVIITNYHVVQDTVNVTVTFINGNGYAAAILGSDPYSDLAVLSIDAPQSEYAPLEIVASSTLEVGDPVIAVGNPYGLAGSMTTGIVSALGRTITEDMSGSYPIADVIQTSAPINSGNSGGPLLNYDGQVVGITTAIVSDSQGLGFAIPSSTILREIGSLVTSGSYTQHPWLGVSGTDMTYEVAEATGADVTYGFLIAQITSGGPADKAGLHGGTQQIVVEGTPVTIGGDIVTAINGTRIRNMDDLSTYLEESTLPGQKINVTIVRSNQTMTLTVELETRP